MEKHIQKQQALDLRRAGLSFDAIAKEIGAAKSTVHRWINEEKENNGTPETPVGTGFGTIAEQNGTNYETKLQNETVYEPIAQKKHDESSSERSKLPEVEIRKAELNHEYRMEDLKFQKEQYRDKRDAQLKAEETEQWQQQINSNRAKPDCLQNEKVETNDHPTLMVPVKFKSRLGELLRQYLSFDDKDCSLEFLEEIEEKVSDLNIEINAWANEHDFDMDNNDDKIIIDSFISDLEESLENFAAEEADVLSLAFDISWKADMEEWLELCD